MKIRTQLKAGGWMNHSEALRVPSAVKAGAGWSNNHSVGLRTRTCLKARGWTTNHSETLRREPTHDAISMRRELRTTAPKADRLELLVIRAGLRAGARARNVRRERV